MKATTIKVEGELLAELERAKPTAQSLTTYVRSVLRQEVRRQQMIAAADRYTEFLHQHPDERAWLDAWDCADLARPPKRKR
jgi:predicted transcriptional regulator